jgi:hypothetical protein
MNCAEVRTGLVDGQAKAPSAGVLEHLEECPGCVRFAERLRMATKLFREEHAGVEPDAGFAARVVASLPSSSPEVLGWAALRLLPATLALALVLTAWALAVTPSPTSLLDQSLDDDLLSWILSTPRSGS